MVREYNRPFGFEYIHMLGHSGACTHGVLGTKPSPFSELQIFLKMTSLTWWTPPKKCPKNSKPEWAAGMTELKAVVTHFFFVYPLSLFSADPLGLSLRRSRVGTGTGTHCSCPKCSNLSLCRKEGQSGSESPKITEPAIRRVRRRPGWLQAQGPRRTHRPTVNGHSVAEPNASGVQRESEGKLVACEKLSSNLFPLLLSEIKLFLQYTISTFPKRLQRSLPDVVTIKLEH